MYFETMSFKKTAKLMNISSSTVHRWVTSTPNLQKVRTRTHRRVIRRTRRKVTDPMVHTIFEHVMDRPVTTLRHIQQCIQLEYGCTLHRQTLARVLKVDCNITRKRTQHRLAGGANVSQERIDLFKQKFTQYVEEGRLFCSVDECNNSEKVLPKEGYSIRGTKCVVRAPTNTWQQQSLLLGVSSDGTHHHVVTDGAFNKVKFQEFMSTLRCPRGTVIIMDNIGFHRDVSVLERRGFIPLFTPPYSPQFNPVECIFSKTKHVFRSLWPWPKGVRHAVHESVAVVTPMDIINTFDHVHGIVNQ